MNYPLGDNRILFFKIDGVYMPVGCLTSNGFSESSETIDTTTRDNRGWRTFNVLSQNYSLSFAGLSINTTMTGGNFAAISHDKLKLLKRERVLIDWKLEAADYPVVDYGKCRITDLSETADVNTLLSFTGTAQGWGKPLTTSTEIVLLNNGDPNVIIATDETGNVVLRVNDN